MELLKDNYKYFVELVPRKYKAGTKLTDCKKTIHATRISSRKKQSNHLITKILTFP